MTPITPEAYAAIGRIAFHEAGLFLPASKRAFVVSRLQRRLRHHGFLDFAPYLALLLSRGAGGAAEREAFVSALTTNVTEIFREPHHFEVLATQLDTWRQDRFRSRSRFRIWSAGCASGEEPLSIAATCRAILGSQWRIRVRILATDVDRAMIDRARNRAKTIDPPTIQRLAALPAGVSSLAGSDADPVRQGIADLLRGIEFVQHNVLHELSPSEFFDAIFCRNVTIYFSPEAQEQAHVRLRTRLAPGGLLAIGHSERLLGDVTDMEAVGRTAFRRKVASESHYRAEPSSCC